MPISVKTVITIAFVIFWLAAPLIFYTKVIYADTNIQCSGRFSNYVQSANIPNQAALGETFPISVTFSPVADTSFKYSVKATQLGAGIGPINIGNFDVRSTSAQSLDPTNPTINFSMDKNNNDHIGAFQVSLMHSEGLGEDKVCDLGTVNFFSKEFNETSCNIKMPNNIKLDESFQIILDKTDKPDIKQTIYFYRKQDLNISLLPKGITYVEMARNGLPIINKFAPNGRVYNSGELPQNSPGTNGITITYDNTGGNRLIGGDYIAVVEARKFLGLQIGLNTNDRWFVLYCSSHPFTVSSTPTSAITDGTPITNPGAGGIIGGGEIKSKNCLEKAKEDPTVQCAESGGQVIKGCSDPNDPNDPTKTNPHPGIATAIGCIHTNPAEFAKDLMTWVIGIGGGVAFLMMLLGAFQMLTSAGNPDTLSAGRERLTSAVIGLLIVIFAILLMQIIGWDILRIPGFGR